MNVPDSQTAGPPRSAYAEASAWLAQLHGPERSTDLEADFRSWLNANPEHAHAFERVTDVWNAVGSANVGGLPRLAHEPFTPTRTRLYLSVATLILGVIGSGAYLALRVPSYSTDIGEQRVVSLNDGTRVSLNSGTELKVDFRDKERIIRLEAGEALFEVAPQPQRPFSVLVGDRRVTALGTSFVVRREPDRLDVTLLDGKITIARTQVDAPPSLPAAQEDNVQQPPANARRALMLSPGQRFTVRADRTETLDTPQTDVTTAWRRGEVILDDTPLSDAIAEMNRYDRNRLVVDELRIKKLPISGIYRTGNNRDFAHAVATMYGLEVSTDGGKIRLRKRGG